MTYEYNATVVRVIDGDTVIFRLEKTFTLDIDFGFYIKDSVSLVKETQMSFRLLGIDCPEVVGANKAAGLASKSALENLLSQGPIRIVTHKADSFGRWLCEVYVTTTDREINVNQEMINIGAAIAYTKYS